MATDIKLATFNVENLYRRYKLLNLSSHEVGDTKLHELAEFKKEIKKDTYDKAKILQLYDGLKNYITIEETRCKFFKNRKKKGIKANGKSDWDGVIKLKPDKFTEPAIKNTAKVIKEVDADVICLIEVENFDTLKKFNNELLKEQNYDYSMLIDGNDDRGIDVALLSRYKICAVKTHIFDRTKRSNIFSRDCLEIQVVLPTGDNLWILINHFKSKGYGARAKNDSRRQLQAQTVSNILSNNYDLNQELVIVAGDLNDTPSSKPLQPLLCRNDIHDCLAQVFPNSIDDRWTYHYKKNEQIDYLLVSGKLMSKFNSAGVERRGIFDVNKYTNGTINAWSSVQNSGYSAAASDHGAVWANFHL